MDNNSEDETFMLQLQEPTENPTPEENAEEGDEIEDRVADQAEPLVKTFKEAIASLEDVQYFLESKGHLEVSFKVGSIVDTVAALQSNFTQTSIFDYFTHQQT